MFCCNKKQVNGIEILVFLRFQIELVIGGKICLDSLCRTKPFIATKKKRKHTSTGRFLLEETLCRTKLWESVGVEYAEV